MEAVKISYLIVCAALISSCSDEKDETRCYPPGALRQVSSSSDRFPQLPCLQKNEAKTWIEKGCENLDIEAGPSEKTESGQKLCCYETKVSKKENCVPLT